MAIQFASDKVAVAERQAATEREIAALNARGWWPEKPVKTEKKIERLKKEIKAIAADPLGAKRGRPSTGRVKITIRLKPETVAAFRAHGPGWQALVSDILDAAAPKG